jgi:hypothetical protein
MTGLSYPLDNLTDLNKVHMICLQGIPSDEAEQLEF